MSLACNLTSPKLTFAESELIAKGVEVKPLDFEALNAQTPFKSTVFMIMPGCITPLDKHKVEECWIILSGEGILEYEGQSLTVREQDVFYFASFKEHQVRNESDKPLVISSIYW